MRSTLYTNVVLSIIAVCLIYQCVNPMLHPPRNPRKAGAQQVEVISMPPVEISGIPTVSIDGEPDINISGIFGKVWKNPDAAWGMPVTIVDSCELDVSSGELDVNVTNPSLSVEVESMPGRY